MTVVEWNTKSAGDEEADGSICAGITPGGGIFFTTPADAPLTYTFNEAAEYAAQLNAQKYLGHDDWRVPSKGELNVLYENRHMGKLKGTFNETGSNPAGLYWSSSRNYDNGIDYAWVKRFSGGHLHYQSMHLYSSLRCVRG